MVKSGLFSSAVSIPGSTFIPETIVATDDLTINTTQGSLPIATVEKILLDNPDQREILFNDKLQKSIAKSCYFGTLLTGFTIMTTYVGYLGIMNAQPSLGGDQQLSMITWATFYAGNPLGSFFAASMTRHIGTRWTYALSSFPYVLYPLAMYYPSFYTTLPLAGLCGAFLVVFVSNDSTYMMHLALQHSLSSGVSIAEAFGKFKAITTAFFYLAYTAGNLIVSLILGDFYTVAGETITSNQTVEYNKTCGISYTYTKLMIPPAVHIHKQYIMFAVLCVVSVCGWIAQFFSISSIKVFKWFYRTYILTSSQHYNLF